MRFFVIPSEDAEARRKWLSERLGTEEMNALFQEAYAILRNKESAYDAVYNALLKGLKCNRLRDDNRMFYQMVQFVRNEAYAYPKHFSMRAWWRQARLRFRKPPYKNGAQYLAIRERSNARLRATIEALNSPEKEILRMRIHEEKEFPEIAKELHMRDNAVRAQYRRILKKVKHALAEDISE